MTVLNSEPYSQAVKFVGVGVLNTAFGYLCYVLFVYLGFDYKMAVLMATIIGVFFNYYTIGNYVFGSSGQNLILKFILVYIVIYFMNILLIKLFKNTGYNDYLSGFFAVIPCAVISFALNKFYVFRKQEVI